MSPTLHDDMGLVSECTLTIGRRMKIVDGHEIEEEGMGKSIGRVALGSDTMALAASPSLSTDRRRNLFIAPSLSSKRSPQVKLPS